MVKVIKSIIAKKPEDLVKLKCKTGIIFWKKYQNNKKRNVHKIDKYKDI